MLSRFVIGGLTVIAIASSFVGTSLSLTPSAPSKEPTQSSPFSKSELVHSQVLITYGELTSRWESYRKESNNSWNPAILYSALEYASEKHRGQVRKDAEETPYIVHPMGVAKILWDEGNVRDMDILMAALLHDTLEDTDATEEEIGGMFGNRVLSIVKEVSNDPTLSGQENKQRQIEHAPFMSKEAKLVKLADRLYNIRDLQAATPINWSKADVDRYFSWGEKLLQALAGTDQNLEGALRWELTHEKSEKKDVISRSLILG